MKTVVLDPGHGGSDPGAINRIAKIEEAEMALDVVLRTREIIKGYVNVHLTRDVDETVSLSARAALSNEVDADLFLSYHFNSAESRLVASSHEVYTTRGETHADEAATIWTREHGKRFPKQKLRADRRDGDPDKEANFAVLRLTNAPAILVEGEFIHTTVGAQFIKDPANRQLMAEANAATIFEFLEIDEPTPITPHQDPKSFKIEAIKTRLACAQSELSRISDLLNS